MLEKIENELCIINYSKSLKELADDTLLLLKDKIKEYEKLFDFSNVTSYTDMFRNIISTVELIVKDEEKKTWLTNKFTYLTNIKLVSEL